MARIINAELRTIGGITGMFYGVEADTYEEAKALIEGRIEQDTAEQLEPYYEEQMQNYIPDNLAEWF